ncbi:MAG: lamin tail domain-containing protein [Arthrobacter sp.]|jgi:LPXTG-motif cell wall-anchored protein|nr:lamin tail domain-containing protein [Arthrobacter sp.]
MSSSPRLLAPATLAAALTLGLLGAPLASAAQLPATLAAPAAPVPATLPVINEVESNGDDTDWVELGNPSDAELDVSGLILTDAEPAKKDHAYTLPAGSIIPAKGLLLVDGAQGDRPGFPFGLGGEDAVKLYAAGTDVTAADATPLVEYAWTAHAPVTYGRCPDLTGDFAPTTRSTKGTPNDCSSPLVINEVVSNGGDPDDWVELYNTGAAAVDPNGLVLTDSEPEKAGHRYTLAGLDPVPAGGFLRLDVAQFGFGLGKADAVRLLGQDGAPVDEYAWQEHAATSYGRCPDGSGDFALTQRVTPGAANACGEQGGGDGISASPWPGGQSVTALDAADETRGDWSGIDHEPGSQGAPGALWVVQNGDGELYRLDSSDAGVSWQRTRGYELRYADGTGTVDAEGVTVTSGGSAAGVYVSSERDNDAKSISRPAVLRYDLPTGDTGSAALEPAAGTPVLKASAEWNLAADFPGLGANSGLEGVTWIPDTWLTANAIADERTGAVYSPADYPGHGDGLFAVGVEGTGGVYLYALMDDGGFARIATIDSGFDVVADLQFDAERDALWVVCDDACNGRIAVFSPRAAQAETQGTTTAAPVSAVRGAQAVQAEGAADAAADGPRVFTRTALYERPADTQNYGNEGFAIADLSQCKNGAVPTFYADDNNTDGHSLRTGTLAATCPEPETPVDPETPGDGGADNGGNGTDPGTDDGADDGAGDGSEGNGTNGSEGSGTGAESGTESGSNTEAGTGNGSEANGTNGDAGSNTEAGTEPSGQAAGEAADTGLAHTGSASAPWLLTAGGLVAAGALLLALRVRRRA